MSHLKCITLILSLFLVFMPSCSKSNPGEKSGKFKGTSLTVVSDTICLNGKKQISLAEFNASTKAEFREDTSTDLDSSLMRLNSSWFDPNPADGIITISEPDPEYTGDSITVAVESSTSFSTLHRLLSLSGRNVFNHVTLWVDQKELVSFSLVNKQSPTTSAPLSTTVIMADSAVTIGAKNGFLPSIFFEPTKEGNIVRENRATVHGWYEKKTNYLLTNDEGKIFDTDLESGVTYQLVHTRADDLNISADRFPMEDVSKYERRALKAEDKLQNDIRLLLERYPEAEDRLSVIIAAEDQILMGKVGSFIERLKTVGMKQFWFALLKA